MALLVSDWEWGIWDGKPTEAILQVVSHFQLPLGKSRDTEFMALGKAIHERATEATCLLIDGKPVNPWLVEIDFAAKGSVNQTVELHLGLPILIFELQQSGMRVEHENILSFVLDDIKDHREAALSGYLCIARHVVNPRPRRKDMGWFARVFTKPPAWTPPKTLWKWGHVDQVQLLDQETLAIKGECHGV